MVVLNQEVQNYETFIKILKERYPEQAIDLRESLELVHGVLGEIVELSGKSVESLINKRAFDSIDEIADYAKIGHGLENKVNQIIDVLTMDELDDTGILDEYNPESDTEIRDYEAYKVDTSVEYTLYEDFTHKRPYGFKLNDDHVVEVSNWKGLYLKLCEIFYALDPDKFLAFEHDSTFNGYSRKYFSSDKTLVHKPHSIEGSIYVGTVHSANAIRNLIVKMLRAYGYKTYEFKVYYRADYTGLNKG